MLQLAHQLLVMSVVDDRGEHTSADDAYELFEDLIETHSEQEKRKRMEEQVDEWLGRK